MDQDIRETNVMIGLLCEYNASVMIREEYRHVFIPNYRFVCVGQLMLALLVSLSSNLLNPPLLLDDTWVTIITDAQLIAFLNCSCSNNSARYISA